jgi:maltose alpha-D-glucosyltransferase/alpha-amylase
MDPVYGYGAVNVEAQVSDPSSLLHWMRNMLGLRKWFKVFGRGSIEFLHPQNRKVLAYLRRYGDDKILCVANLSRFAQAVELDLSSVVGLKPVEMLGYTDFPIIDRSPYRLTLNPYGFFWFELQRLPEPIEVRSPAAVEELATLSANNWRELFESDIGDILEKKILTRFLLAQRWFAGKGKKIEQVHIHDWTELGGATSPAALTLLRVRYFDSSSETYFVPLSIAITLDVEPLITSMSERVLCRLHWNGNIALLSEGSADDEMWRVLLDMIKAGSTVSARRGVIHTMHTDLFARLHQRSHLPISRPALEQSNTSVCYGNAFMLKVYRKIDLGLNPEFEILRHLTETGFENTPALAGGIDYVPFGGQPQSVAILQSAVENQGTGWDWMMEELSRFYEYCAFAAETEGGGTPNMRQAAGLSLEAAATLGRRAAELHLALASSKDPAFSPELFSVDDQTLFINTLRADAARTFQLFRDNLSRLPEDLVAEAEQLLSRENELFDLIEDFDPLQTDVYKIRVHGDFHLAQVLRVRNDYVIIDFEGEPGRSCEERRAKTSALKDVAGMLRSFSYVAHAALAGDTNRRSDQLTHLLSCTTFWRSETSAVFLREYCERAKHTPLLPQDEADCRRLLDLYILEKALYELRYEINNRPAWVRIPMQAIAELMQA